MTYNRLGTRNRSEFYNIVFASLFICLSITSHLIAYRLVSVGDYVIIPSTVTYMLCFSMVDIFSSFNARKTVLLIIALEAITNLIMILITNIVISMPYPDVFEGSMDYYNTFNPISNLFVANIFGSFVAFVLNSIIFSYFYRNKKLSFITSSILSFVVVVVVYTTITDYLAFNEMYSDIIYSLTLTNMVTNSVLIIFYSLISNQIVRYINRRLI
ncbi:VUT family protein [Photorhabdus heterorhabditis]|uniref:VUT family protein n=1 Tax=Photorhabdus heterorhabditis TaxID=880156 RepID=A0A5B0WQ38_9GAMM|nr:VUT family protein [Photorhabdus heterorhabditis]KAA1188271.1 VUT family protein [Photorhabdus heterorhabditis]KOY62384.1 hypothetical protein AM629_08515 [Photorhabdus heterorhabditis]MBS9444127.1 hypothetical protein [Photorhabdus heterorhabditis]